MAKRLIITLLAMAAILGGTWIRQIQTGKGRDRSRVRLPNAAYGGYYRGRQA